MLVYNLDIAEGSLWLRTTPSGFARKQPYYCTEAGIFYAGVNFNTVRDFKDFRFSGSGDSLEKRVARSATGQCLVVARRVCAARRAGLAGGLGVGELLAAGVEALGDVVVDFGGLEGADFVERAGKRAEDGFGHLADLRPDEPFGESRMQAKIPERE